MGRKPIPELLRKRVEERAQYKCEYCTQSLRGQRAHIDHIIPGFDSIENYALACQRCNENKSNFLEHEDPVTGISYRLFNPRLDRWDLHFRYYTRHVIGRTGVGRATATLLFRQTTADIHPNLNWRWAQRIREEDIAEQINSYRGWRLANRFDWLEQIAPSLLNELKPGTENYRLVQFALAILNAEAYMMRSRVTHRTNDLILGLQTVSSAMRTLALSSDEKTELLSIRSILFQQFATTRALLGYFDQAIKLQEAATKAHAKGLTGQSLPEFTAEIRKRSLATKYIPPTHQLYTREEMKLAIADGSKGETRSLVYIADLELAKEKPSKLAEQVLEGVEDLLGECGYGQDFDYAASAVLRRRWWALRAWASEPINIDLLKKDLNFLQRIRMYNEVRELHLLFLQIIKKRFSSSAYDALEAIKRSYKLRV